MKKKQKLHQLAVTGGKLTAEEKKALSNWYETLDKEDSLLNKLNQSKNTQNLQEQISHTSKQITKISSEIESLVIQNAAIKRENQKLRKFVEKRLLERAA